MTTEAPGHLFGCSSAAILTALVAGAVTPLSAAGVQHVIPRNGIPNVLARMKAGEATTIAYLGGSITAGADAWPTVVTDALKEEFPGTPVEMVNIAIGATGSTLAAFRMDREVLPKNPDLIVMEFAVNDWHSVKDCIDSYEGIIRKVWNVRPSCDFLFVHTINKEWIDDLRNQRDVVTVRRHEAVAGYYGIPSINIGRKFVSSIENGELKWEDVMGDTVHPHQEGHKVYAQIVKKGLAALTGIGEPFDHELGEPLYSGDWASATMVPPAEAEAVGDWADQPVPWGPHFFDGVRASDTAGSSLRFRFTGPVIGVFIANGPGAGDTRWRVDEGNWTEIPAFVPEWWKDLHPFWWILKSKLDTQTQHVLEIEILGDPNTGEAGSLKLGALLCAPTE